MAGEVMRVVLPKAEVVTLYQVEAARFQNPRHAAAEAILIVPMPNGRTLRSDLSQANALLLLDHRHELRKIFDWYDKYDNEVIGNNGEDVRLPEKKPS